ncbi:MAG: hypothetical protein LQ344_002071 [Seirophora lacunosa]|nr:MAG: hypothetical protein LQ344_002071 [Seirophora lacunosa]
MHQTTDKPFRVIIVGAGVSGLILAHALQLAKTDFVLLEKGVVAPPWGSSITGIISTCKYTYPLTDSTSYPDLTLERREFLQILYDELPDKSKVLTGKRVKHVEDNEEEISVELTDGSVEKGDLVVGGDGVHSTIRGAMWATANKAIPGFISEKEKQSEHAMVATYNCLLGIAPMQPGLGTNDMTMICNDGFTFQNLCQPDAIYFMIHHKLPEPIRHSERVRYTDEDAEKVAAKYANHRLSENLVFGDLWRSRTRANLVSLEEGVLEHFFFGRTVLIGDAAHKVTPNAAMGGLSAIEDSIALANAIHGLTQSHPDGKPSKDEVTTALQQYQDERKPRLQRIHDDSAMVTRLMAHDTWYFYLLMRWILPMIGLFPLVHTISKLGSQGPRLRYAENDEVQGTVPWSDPQPKRQKKIAAAA